MSQWISVKDRLPEIKGYLMEDQRVFVARGKIVLEAKYSNGKFRSVESGSQLDPTHWMPLPEPPPKPDAFEEWYLKRSGKFDQITYREVWDAAVAATRKEK